MNKLIWIILLIITSSFIPLISGKELDSSKRIGANSTVGVIGFSPNLSFSSIENNKTIGMTKISNADMGDGYAWVDIGFINSNKNNTMIIKTLMENYINYTSTIVNTTQIIWVPSKDSPTIVTGGTFTWNNTTKLITIINSALDIIIEWFIIQPITIALPLFIIFLVGFMGICMLIATRRKRK
jgi:hypothetical protein